MISVSTDSSSHDNSSKPNGNIDFHAEYYLGKELKKLKLVLDLDQTLLHSTGFAYLTSDEEYLVKDPRYANDDVFVDKLMITKLRPFVRTFLKEASRMFEMYIYTAANQSYAQRMADLLDPKKEYFSSDSMKYSRVISRDNHTSGQQLKSLDLVPDCNDSDVVIIDDTPEAWTEKNQDNLIVMPEYCFFNDYDGRTSLAELKADEGGEILKRILEILKLVHALSTFDSSTKDVRNSLKILQKKVSRGCEIAFDYRFSITTESS